MDSLEQLIGDVLEAIALLRVSTPAAAAAPEVTVPIAPAVAPAAAAAAVAAAAGGRERYYAVWAAPRAELVGLWRCSWRTLAARLPPGGLAGTGVSCKGFDQEADALAYWTRVAGGTPTRRP